MSEMEPKPDADTTTAPRSGRDEYEAPLVRLLGTLADLTHGNVSGQHSDSTINRTFS